MKTLAVIAIIFAMITVIFHFTTRSKQSPVNKVSASPILSAPSPTTSDLTPEIPVERAKQVKPALAPKIFKRHSAKLNTSALRTVSSEAPAVPEKSAHSPTASDLKKITREFSRERLWLWGGLGFSYSNFSQDVTDVQNVKVAGFKKPSYFFKAGAWLSESVGADVSFVQTSSQVEGSTGFAVTNGNFSWQTMTVDFMYRLSDEPSEPNVSHDSELNLRFGLQAHQVPLLVPSSGTSLNVETANIATASIGFEYKKYFSQKARFELLMHYQQPFDAAAQAGARYEVDSNFVFDGSVGYVYHLTPELRLGTYWYGQWHSYKFNYNNPSAQLNVSGQQSLFHSSMDVRLGWEF